MRRALVGLALAALVLWLASLAAVVAASLRDEAAPADAIIVLGAAQYNGRPSPVLRARLEHAVSLYRRHLAPLVVVTGGMGHGDTTSEAAVARRWLLEAGVPDSAVVAVAAGRTSESSLRSAAHHVSGPSRRVLLVSDGFHIMRLAVIARRLGLSPLGSPAARSPISASLRRQLPYLLAESVKVPIAFLLTRSS